MLLNNLSKKKRKTTKNLGLLFMVCMLILGAALMTPDATISAAGIVVVNETADELNADNDCSLREAIESVNTGAAVDNCAAPGAAPFTISVPAGTYTLSLAGANEDGNQTGDLDILEDVSIVGAGSGLNLHPGRGQYRYGN